MKEILKILLHLNIPGEVSWEEYHAYFLRSHGFPENYVSSHDKKHSDMSRNLKENIMRDRARWSEAARNDPERLALDEFLAFTHPESSHRALLQMVEDLFEKFGVETYFFIKLFLHKYQYYVFFSFFPLHKALISSILHFLIFPISSS